MPKAISVKEIVRDGEGEGESGNMGDIKAALLLQTINNLYLDLYGQRVRWSRVR